jgi:hypothetical protein
VEPSDDDMIRIFDVDLRHLFVQFHDNRNIPVPSSHDDQRIVACKHSDLEVFVCPVRWEM